VILDHRACFAGLWRRAAAALLDAGLVALALALLAATVLVLDPATPASTREGALALARVLAGPVGATFGTLVGAALVGCWMSAGATPGKLLAGVRVVDARSGGRVRGWQALVRLAGYALVIASLGLGFAWAAFDRRRRALHDRMALTVVVEEDESLLSLDELRAAL